MRISWEKIVGDLTLEKPKGDKMVIKVNFNLEGITHEEYMGAAKEVAPAFKEQPKSKEEIHSRVKI